jgi:hypothetical protein
MWHSAIIKKVDGVVRIYFKESALSTVLEPPEGAPLFHTIPNVEDLNFIHCKPELWPDLPKMLEGLDVMVKRADAVMTEAKQARGHIESSNPPQTPSCNLSQNAQRRCASLVNLCLFCFLALVCIIVRTIPIQEEWVTFLGGCTTAINGDLREYNLAHLVQLHEKGAVEARYPFPPKLASTPLAIY